LVIDAGSTPLKKLEVLEEEEYQKYKGLLGEASFKAGTGAEAILRVLEGIKIE